MPSSIEVLGHKDSILITAPEGNITAGEQDKEIILVVEPLSSSLILNDSSPKVIVENLETEVVEITSGETLSLSVNTINPKFIVYDDNISKLELVEPDVALSFVNDVVAILSVAEQGPAGTSDANFVFTQVMATNTWNITHGLGKYPSVTVVDSGQSVVIGDVDYISVNELTINFNSSFGGHAYLN